MAMTVSQLKGLAAVCIWLASLLGGLLPFWLKRHAAAADKAKAKAVGDSEDSTTIPPADAVMQVDDHAGHHDVDQHEHSHEAERPGSPSRGSKGFRAKRARRKSDAAPGGRYGSTSTRTSRRGSLAHGHPHHSHKHGCCHFDVDRFLSFGNMLGAGIFLGGGMLHLLPEAEEGLHELQGTWNAGFLNNYPIAYFLAGVGFFTILLVEEATIHITTSRLKSKAKQKAALEVQERSLGQDGSVTNEGVALAQPTSRNLSRNLVAGLTPRVALIPDRSHSHVRKRRGEDTIEECSAASSDDGDASDSSEAGPIQQFLDATPSSSLGYNSPSPFPSIAERGRRAHQQHHSRYAPPGLASPSSGMETDDSDASEAGTLSGEEVYTASSRAPAVRNNSALRTSNDLVQPTPTGSGLAFTSNLKQPLLDEDSEIPSLLPTTVFVSSGPMATPERGVKQQPRRSKKRSNRLLKSSPKLMHDDEPDHEHSLESAPKAAEPAAHGHGHGGGDHSHVEITADTSYIVAYLLVLALSFHSIFEGIALGTQEKTAATISIFIAIIGHSPLAGFALGVSLVKSRAAPRMALSCLFLFTIMTPLGTVLGLLLSVTLAGTTLTVVSCCFQAFSAGTFFFVAFEEIIPKELALPKDKPIKLALCVLGFVAMAAIKIFDNEDEDE